MNSYNRIAIKSSFFLVLADCDIVQSGKFCISLEHLVH